MFTEMLLLRNEDASRQVHTAKNVFPEYTFSIICLKHIFLKSRQEDTMLIIEIKIISRSPLKMVRCFGDFAMNISFDK